MTIISIRSTYVLFVVTVAFGVWSPVVYSLASDSASEDAEIDLHALSDAELEEICAVRGFELLHGEENTVFTHDDYVEAARQCLAIEQDM